MKEKRLNFTNLANSRVNKAIKILRLISNLSNKVTIHIRRRKQTRL